MPDLLEPTHQLPLRALTAHESNLLAASRQAGPFVAWRGEAGNIHIQTLQAGKPITIGRSADSTIVFEHRRVSREHAEILMRALSRPASVSVLLLDLRSKHGTQYRPLSLERGIVRPVGPLLAVPSQPAGPVMLEPGDHDVRLAGEVWVRIGGVSVDQAITDDRDDDFPEPTRRERDVLVELCRPRYSGRHARAPSNAEIGARLAPAIGSERVSDLLSQMYVKYGLVGTKAQNRAQLVDLALDHGFVGPEDYV